MLCVIPFHDFVVDTPISEEEAAGDVPELVRSISSFHMLKGVVVEAGSFGKG